MRWEVNCEHFEMSKTFQLDFLKYQGCTVTIFRASSISLTIQIKSESILYILLRKLSEYKEIKTLLDLFILIAPLTIPIFFFFFITT